ncbi:MAG: tetratricopeptide repeat-containing protein kinase family protein, partial [Nannocystaceae bacterium]
GRADVRLFIAMALLAGETRRLWHDEQRGWRRWVHAYMQAGAGLAAAHEAGLVHRDFKPDNCMIDEHERVHVLDFGLAREHRDAAAPVAVGADEVVDPRALATFATEAGTVMGTPAYMPLEQVEGKDVDARGDQFSFCAALYEAVYRERPFEGRTMGQLTLALMRGEIRSAPRGSAVPGRLRRVLLRGLSREPEQRWPSMSELLEALQDTVSPRRRWLPAAMVGAGLVALGAGLWAADSEPACLGARRQLDGIWDAPRRQQVQQAIVGTGLAYGAGTWERVEPALSRYAERWIAKHEEVCTATRVQQQQSEEVMDLRMACLQRRRIQLRETVDLLAAATDTRVQRAVDMVASLDEVDACDQVEALRSGLPPPSDPEAAQQVEQSREQLRRVRSLRLAGEYDEGLSLAEEITARAQRLDYGPLLAEALAERGRLRQSSGRYPGAEHDLRDAYALATELRHDEVATAAAVDLTFVVGDLQAEHEQGLWWGMTALALARRLGSDRHESEALQKVGNVLSESGRYDESLEQLERALELAERAWGPEHLQIARVLNDVGNVRWQQADYDAALEHYRRALAMQQEHLGPRHPDIGGALHNIANVLNDQGKYADALEQYQRALQIREEGLGSRHPLVANTLLPIGAMHQHLGQPQEALVHLRRALEIREQALGPEHPDVASSLESIALVSFVQDEIDQAQQYLERALAIRERVLGPQHPALATSLLNLGPIYVRQGQLLLARAGYERAIEINEQALGIDHPRLIAPLNNLGSVFHELGEPDLALVHYRRAVAIAEAAYGPEHPNLGAVLQGMGLVLAEQGEVADALSSSQRALSILESMRSPNPAQLAQLHWELADLLLRSDRLEDARRHAELSRRFYASLAPSHADDLAAVEALLANELAR